MMNAQKTKKERGFIKTVFLILTTLVIISYMGIDLEKAVAEPLFKKNLKYTGQLVKNTWDKVFDKEKKESSSTENSKLDESETGSE